MKQGSLPFFSWQSIQIYEKKCRLPFINCYLFIFIITIVPQIIYSKRLDKEGDSGKIFVRSSAIFHLEHLGDLFLYAKSQVNYDIYYP